MRWMHWGPDDLERADMADKSLILELMAAAQGDIEDGD